MAPPVECNLCGKKFARQWTLKRHLETHNEDRSMFACDRCEKPFARRDFLIRHRQEQHREQQDEEQSCQDCGRHFKRKSSLKSHRLACQARPCFPSQREAQVSTTPRWIKWQEFQTSNSGTVSIAQPRGPPLTFIRSRFFAQVPNGSAIHNDRWESEFVLSEDFIDEIAWAIATAIEGGKVRNLKRIIKALPSEWQSWTKLDQLFRRHQFHWYEPGMLNEPCSLICFAVESGHLNCLQYLVRSGLSINELDLEEPDYIDWMYPLHWAARTGDIDMIEYLLDSGADMEAAGDDNYPWTALSAAVSMEEVEATRLLLSRGADKTVWYDLYTPSLLCGAIHDGFYDIAELLIVHGIDVNKRDGDGHRPLHAAARTGNRDTVAMLLKRGAGIDPVEGRFLITPLGYAAAGGHEDVVKLLIRNGARVDGAPGALGTTPLREAMKMERTDVASLLIEKGADVNLCRPMCEEEPATTTLGILCTPYARSDRPYARTSRPYGRFDTVERIRTLVKHGADVNLGDTPPLEHALGYKGTETVEVLLRSGADISLVSEDCIRELRMKIDDMNGTPNGDKGWDAVYAEAPEKLRVLERYEQIAMLVRGVLGQEDLL